MSFRPSTAGDVELFVMNADGTGVTRLTNAPGEDGGPRAVRDECRRHGGHAADERPGEDGGPRSR
jgi:hypothetical protein